MKKCLPVYFRKTIGLSMLFFISISTSFAQVNVIGDRAGTIGTLYCVGSGFGSGLAVQIELPQNSDCYFSGDLIGNIGGDVINDPIDRTRSYASGKTLVVYLKSIYTYCQIYIQCNIFLGSKIGWFNIAKYRIVDGAGLPVDLGNAYGFRVFPETVETPRLLLSSQITNTSFIASWNDVYYSEGIFLDIATTPSFDESSLLLDNVGLFPDDGTDMMQLYYYFLLPGKTYYYRIRSYYCGMFSPYSNVQSVTLLKNEQSINWNQDLSQYSIQYGDSSVQYGLQISSSSGLPIEFMISNPAIVSIKDDKLYFINVGMVTITAKQSGDETFYAAKDTSQTITVLPRSAYITSAQAESKVYDGTTHTTVIGAILSNIIESDDVHLTNSTSSEFITSNIGNQIEVNTSMTITGSDANKYTLVQPWYLQASIFQPITEIFESPYLNAMVQGANLASCCLTGGRANVAGTFSICNPEYIPISEGELVSYLFTPFDSNYPIQYGQTSVRFNTTTDITTSQDCFKIWINNVNNLIYYSGEKDGAYYKIINASGQIVKDGKLNGIPLSMDELPKGIYVLNIENVMLKFTCH